VQRKLKGASGYSTIHKAKGLEFPIVIIPWIESTGKSGRSQKLWQMLPEGLAVDVKPFDAPGHRREIFSSIWAGSGRKPWRKPR
jgi:ATP-dependent exoDNAse (exonuclease V) beta subunit